MTSYVYKSVPANEKVLLKGKKEKVLRFLFIASEILGRRWSPSLKTRGVFLISKEVWKEDITQGGEELKALGL